MSSTPLSRDEKLAELKKRVAEAKEDPVALANNFLSTFNPKKAPHHFPFKLFPFQQSLAKELKEAIETGQDIFIDKTREMGATYTVLAVLLWFWLYVPGSNFLLGSRKEAMVDNTRGDNAGESNKEESLFGKLEYMITRLPKFLLPNGFDINKHFTFMSLVNPENGNAFSGESANPNFSRGGRQKAIMMDEFAFWDNDSAAWGSTADTSDCRIVLTTPGIRPSKAKRLRFGTDGEKIKVIELPYHLDPRKDANWLREQRERRSEEDFAREIMMNWDTSVKGRVYPEIEHSKVGKFPYNPDWPLYISWDFGLDGLPIQWWQKNLQNGLWRLVEAFATKDQPIQYVFPLFPGNPVNSLFEYSSEFLALQRVVSAWKRGIHFGDPDVSKRSLISEEKSSTRLELERAGIYVQTKPESNKFAIRREKTKVFLQKGIEVNDTPGTIVWMEAMKNARYPQRSENSQATSPIVLPIHDWTSHHRTGTEYLAVNIDDGPKTEEFDYSSVENYQQEQGYTTN
jgi:hypothetical protein